jgi:hypothetical protein
MVKIFHEKITIILSIILLIVAGVSLFFVLQKPKQIEISSSDNNEKNPSSFNPSLLKWEEAVFEGSWSARDAHSVVVFKDKMWLMGGLEGKKEKGQEVMYGDMPHKDDVWSSEDGINWQLVTEHAKWQKRRSCPVVVFKDKMWLFGGWYQETWGYYKNDAWYSEDGKNWIEAARSAEWSAREGHAVVFFKDKIWLAGGVDFYSRKTFNDVWYSEDGIHWEEATSDAGWSPRYDHALIAFQDKLWLIGGLNFNNDIKDDVWSSEDGINWQLVTDKPAWSSRHGHALVVYKDLLWIISGWDQKGGIAEVWYTADGKNWEKPKAKVPWFGREDHAAVVFDDKIWLMGGMADTAKDWVWKNDVWYSTFTP